MATIEIFARDVKGFGIFGAQHLFIIFTNDNGQKFIIRGGPENGHEFYDNLNIINTPYKKQFENLYPNDFIEGNPSTTIFTGTDEQVQAYMDKMIEVAHLINAQKYDYKIPFGESVQNSNTIVNILVNAAGLTFSLPKVKENGKDVWAPGVYGNLEHTNIDQIIEFLLSPYGTLGFAIAMQILLDSQNRGFIISMQNVDFINYAQGRFQDLSSFSMKASNSPSVSSAKGPMGNYPTTNPNKGPVNVPSSGSTRASNNAPTIKSNSSGVPSSSGAPRANVPVKAPVIIPMPACSIAPTLVPEQNYNYQLAIIEIRSRDYESLRT